MKSLLESTQNTRDLGGYITEHGTYTNYNVLLRSDEQTQLNERDVVYLSDRQITTIIDMRGKKDILRKPSPFAQLPQFCYHNIPVEEGSSIPKSVQEVPSSYMEIAGAVNIRRVYQCIANAPHGVLYHCAAGKDRTGVVSAVLLLLVNVSDRQIAENYRMTKEYNQRRLAIACQNFPGIDINIIMPKEEYMLEFLRLFREKYGSAEAYLYDIGVSEKELWKLKRKLV